MVVEMGDEYKSIVGRAHWDVMFSQAREVSSPERARMFRWFLFNYLPVMYPCEECKAHFRTNLDAANKIYPYDSFVKNPETALYFVYTLKHQVNVMLGKPTPQFDEVKKKWLEGCATCSIVPTGASAPPAGGAVEHGALMQARASRVRNLMDPPYRRR